VGISFPAKGRQEPAGSPLQHRRESEP